MKKWKRLAYILLLAPSLTLASDPAIINSIATEDSFWNFSQLKAISHQNQTYVTGRMTVPAAHHLPRGHVDIVVRFNDGNPSMNYTARLRPPTLTHRIRIQGGAKFSSLLPTKMTDIQKIDVSFHPDTFQMPNTPEHFVSRQH